MTARKTALVTGASAGIGRAFAEELARRDRDLVIVARRKERLDAVARELGDDFGVTVTVLPDDLSDPAAPERIAQRIAEAGLTIDVLVNNAGYGVVERFTEAPWKVHADFIQVLVTSLTHLTHLFLPGMVERGYGRVINVASVAAFLPSALGFTLYGGAKSFVVKMSESLSLELAGTGVNVTAVCPGFTHTEFHDVIGVRGALSSTPGFMWMDASTVARDGLDAVDRGSPVYINGLVYRLLSGAARLTPSRLLLASSRIASRRMRGKG
jgi:short-subunit dehydrogenase